MARFCLALTSVCHQREHFNKRGEDYVKCTRLSEKIMLPCSPFLHPWKKCWGYLDSVQTVTCLTWCRSMNMGDYCSAVLQTAFPGIRLFLALSKFYIAFVIHYSSMQMCGWKTFASGVAWLISTHLLKKVWSSFWLQALVHTLFRGTETGQMLRTEHLVMKSHRLVYSVDKE